MQGVQSWFVFLEAFVSQSPELAGGAGFTFGDQVAVRYLACLLGELEGPGLSGRIVSRVALEQRDAGEPLDDIVIDAYAPDGSIARLSLQVKRELTISAAASNSDFRDIVRDAWATLDKPDFRSGVDRVGAVTGSSIAVKKARDLQALAELARASASPSDFERRFAPDGKMSVSGSRPAISMVRPNLPFDMTRSVIAMGMTAPIRGCAGAAPRAPPRPESQSDWSRPYRWLQPVPRPTSR